MSNFGAIIHQQLANDAAVAALVADRIWPEEAPDDAALPLLVYSVKIAADGDGTAKVAPGTVRVNAWCDDDDTAQQLGEAVAAALSDYSGGLDATSVRCLAQSDYEEARSFEFNLWGRLLTFTGLVIQG
jgi:hypothetical protein